MTGRTRATAAERPEKRASMPPARRALSVAVVSEVTTLGLRARAMAWRTFGACRRQTTMTTIALKTRVISGAMPIV